MTNNTIAKPENNTEITVDTTINKRSLVDTAKLAATTSLLLLALNTNAQTVTDKNKKINQTEIAPTTILQGKGTEGMRAFIAKSGDQAKINELNKILFDKEHSTTKEEAQDLNTVINEIYTDKTLTDQDKFDITVLLAGGGSFKKESLLRVINNETTKEKYQAYRAKKSALTEARLINQNKKLSKEIKDINEANAALSSLSK